jgi:hypothetical protein
MEDDIDNLKWETELESLVEFFEKRKNTYELKKKKKIKVDFKFFKFFSKPQLLNYGLLSWRMSFNKNLKKYFFKKVLSKIYEPELFSITTKSRKILKWKILKSEKLYIIKLKKSKIKNKSYCRLFFYYSSWFLNKKIIYYHYK